MNFISLTYNLKMNIDNEHEKYLNLKIIEGKTATNDINLELARYLKEILGKIPTEKDKAMIMQNIAIYFDSLNTLLIKHICEQHNN